MLLDRKIATKDFRFPIFLLGLAFPSSVYVYGGGSVATTTNFRGEDGVFLKRESVRLPLQPVHHFLFLVVGQTRLFGFAQNDLSNIDEASV